MMKHIIGLTAIGIAAILPTAVSAQIFTSGGYSSTTIFVPSGESTTTTTYYSDPNSFTTTPNTIYLGRGNHRRNYYPQPQSSVIFQQNNIYYPATQSSCTTSIIGSPIPSPIPLDQNTGRPCR
jgi:hypothetical protein